LSQRLGFFVESEKGRQQLALKRLIGDNILATGYCLTPRNIAPHMHPEQGTVWEWIYEHDEDIFGRFSDCYGECGAGALRRIDDESMAEIRRIFEISGGQAFYDNIEACSERKAREMGYDGATEEYMMDVYTYNSENHY
jgi:heterodisulfide reductase subunit C